VDGHQPPAPQERPPGQLPGHRHGHLVKQQLHRLRAQPLARLGEPTRRRHGPRLIPAPPRRQRLGQPGSDLLIVLLRKQRQRHREKDHHWRRHLPTRPPPPLPRRRDRLNNSTRGTRGRHPPQRNPTRQTPTTPPPPIVPHAQRSCRTVTPARRYKIKLG